MGRAGLVAADTLATIGARTFANVPLRYGVEVDARGEHVAVETGDAAGSARVKLWARTSGALVIVDGIVSSPHFLGGELVVASSQTGTATEPAGRTLSFVALSGNDLGRTIRTIDTHTLGLTGDWASLAAARDDALAVVADGVVVVCDPHGHVRARIPIAPKVFSACFDGADIVVATDDGRVAWHAVE